MRNQNGNQKWKRYRKGWMIVFFAILGTMVAVVWTSTRSCVVINVGILDHIPRILGRFQTITMQIASVRYDIGDYPPPDSPLIKRILDEHSGYKFHYDYPSKICKEAPFDLIWCGPNEIYERGKGDDLCFTEVLQPSKSKNEGFVFWELKPAQERLKAINKWRKRARACLSSRHYRGN